MNHNNYAVSWSGGKDGCMACYRAIRQGLNVTGLVNFISDDNKRVRFHETDNVLIQMQAQSLGMQLVQPVTSWENYERDFIHSVSELKVQNGITGMIFGDIYLQEHLDWVKGVCNKIGIEAEEPLWGYDTRELLDEFIDTGFEAVIVSTNAGIVERDWLGKKIDRAFVKYLIDNGIDCCGEKGEYHTLVTGGPIFKKKIRLLQTETVSRDGYWLLDVKKYDFA